MVRVVRPPPPLLLLPPPPLSLPPQADTPRARAVRRQPAAATERTCKGPSSGTRYRRRWIVWGPEDVAQRPTGTGVLTLNEDRRGFAWPFHGPRRTVRSAGCPVDTAGACARWRPRGRSAP